jgi:hypothetical protein
MNRKCLLVVAALAVVGCAHTPTESAPTKYTRVVKIETDPPGMRIYFGIAGTEARARDQREFVGTSPCSLTVPCDGDGRFENNVSGFARPKAVFMAEPPAGATNLFAQNQIFAVPAMFIRPPPIPKAVFFDMAKATQ